MSDKPANPPAFPFEELRNTSSDPLATPRRFQHGGMTLRDWFAGQALGGLLAAPHGLSFGASFSDNNSAMASVSYILADAMLAERSKP